MNTPLRYAGGRFRLIRCLPLLPGLLFLAAAAPAAVPAKLPPPAIPPLIPAAGDGLETRTGRFSAEYPPPPDAEATRLVQLLGRRAAAPTFPNPTRAVLLAFGRTWEKEHAPEQQPGARAGGRAAAPAPTTRRAAPAASPDTKAPWRFDVYVPPDYRPGQLYGLLVWISAGGRGDVGRYAELCDQYHLIWIGPADVGNDRYPPWRSYMALEALLQARKRFTLDDRRLYVSGASGGGRMASQIAIQAADLFAGGVYVIGTNYLRDIPVPDKPGRVYPGFWNRPDPMILAHAKADGRYVLLTGTNDFNRESTQLFFKAYQEEGFAHASYVEVPDMGHQSPPPDWYGRAVEFLDSTLPDASALNDAAAGAEKQKKMGDAYLAYARAAIRGGGGDAAKDADANAAAIYADYSREVARIGKLIDARTTATLPADLRAFRARFGPLADARAAAFEAQLKAPPPKPATVPARATVAVKPAAPATRPGR